jgi:predicted outer membrane protein
VQDFSNHAPTLPSSAARFERRALGYAACSATVASCLGAFDISFRKQEDFMRLNKRHVVSIVSAAALALVAATVVAQEAPRKPAFPAGKNPQRVTANRPVEGAENADRTIADCLAISNQEEIALATLAAGKSQNPKVKQFAETLIKDHNQLLSQLKQFGAQGVALNFERDAAEPGPRDQAREDRPAARQTVPQQRTAFTSQGGLDFAAIKRQMAQKCIETAQKQWTEKKGNDADMCFVGSQTVLHQQMLNGLEVLRPYASPELQAVIDQGISTTREHLAHGEKLLKELIQQASAAAAERPTS